MISVMFILGIASIFASGVLAHSYGSNQRREDFYISVIGFSSGVFILITMIGSI